MNIVCGSVRRKEVWIDITEPATADKGVRSPVDYCLCLSWKKSNLSNEGLKEKNLTLEKTDAGGSQIG